VPAYEGGPLRAALAGRAILLGIADPSLLRDPALRIAWYAGHEGFDVPRQIATVVQRLCAAWRVARLVYASGSTGGHAALLQSARAPGSVAVVQNPIAHISGYSRGAVEQYRRTCWPSLPATQPLSDVTVDDVGALYGKDLANSVVLLQNARDHHLHGQSLRFLQGVTSKRNRRSLLYLSDFYADHEGHTFPRAVWTRWVLAAAEAPDTDVSTIAKQAAQQAAQPAAPAEPAPWSAAATRHPTPGPDARDLAWNARLLEQSLREVH
jgi:hypothetical protein